MSDSAAFELVAGRYRLESRIGSGAFGEVWRATDTLLSRPVAVKLMRAELAGEQLAARRFQAEARHAGSLAHEAIVKVYDYGAGTSSQRPYLVMEYVPGSSLAEKLSAGQLGAARAMDIVAQVAAGLDAAHTIGLAHGDIKPHNVLLGTDGRVKLTDFGVSFAPGSVTDGTLQDTLLGTPEYQAPERMTGSKGNAASDLYSVGIIAWQCLTGRVPFRGRAVEVAHAHRTWPLPPLPPGTPPQVERLVAELTAKDPAQRPDSAADVARRAAMLRDELALVPSGAGSPPGPGAGGPASQTVVAPEDGPHSAAPGPPPPRPGRDRRRVRAALGAAAVIVIAVICTGALLAMHRAGRSGGSAPAARVVDVNGASLRGQPVAAVVAQLRGQGLIVTIQWLAGSGVRAGLVISVRPSGWLAPGSRVLVTGAAPASRAASPKPGRSPVPGPGLPPPFAPTSPPGQGGPPTLSSSPAPSATPSSTGSPSPSPSVSVTPTPTSPSPTPSPSGSSGAAASPPRRARWPAARSRPLGGSRSRSHPARRWAHGSVRLHNALIWCLCEANPARSLRVTAPGVSPACSSARRARTA